MKKGLILTLVLILFAAVSPSAMAQLTQGRDKSYNQNSTMDDIITEKKNVENYVRVAGSYQSIGTYIDGSSNHLYDGFGVQVTGGIPLSQKVPLYLEIGGLVNAAFGTIDEINYSYASLQLPINVTYAFSLSDAVKISPLAGIGAKAIIVGNASSESESYNLLSSYDVPDDILWSIFHINWRVGVNLDIHNFTLGFTYGSDFTPVMSEGESYFTNMAISVGWKF